MQPRKAQIKRDTGETKIRLSLNIDGKGKSKIDTGVPFFDHMLTLFAKHATMDLNLRCNGDVEVDHHHTVEDCGIALGQAFAGALGDKKGVRRYGTGFDPRNPFTGEAHVPMDECLARCVVDFSNRPHLVWRGLARHHQKGITDADKSQDMSSVFRFGLAREIFSRRSPTTPGATCTSSCCTATSLITSWRGCSRRSPGRPTLPANTTPELPGSCPARRGNCSCLE